jgi:hypothetical protein
MKYSLWLKVGQGRPEYTKDPNFNLFAGIKFPFHQKLIMIEHTHHLEQRSFLKGQGHSVFSGPVVT